MRVMLSGDGYVVRCTEEEVRYLETAVAADESGCDDAPLRMAVLAELSKTVRLMGVPDGAWPLAAPATGG